MARTTRTELRLRRNAHNRKRRGSVAIAFVLAFAMLAGPASADHNVSFTSAVGGTPLTSAPGGTATLPATANVSAGSIVDFVATSAAGGNHVQIHQCLTRDRVAGGNAVVTPDQPLPVAACEVNNPDFGNPDGVWVLRDQENPPGPAEYAWNTTNFVGSVAGFRAQRAPVQGHADGHRYIQLTVVVGGGGDGHPGCRGIQNAYSKVTSNNGASKGKGKGAEALEDVAGKLGCDLSS
jgi:hypothetical protein